MGRCCCLSSRAAQTARDLTNEVKDFFVYMMTNRTRGVLYTGVTNDLERRVSAKNASISGSTWTNSSASTGTDFVYFEN